MMEKKYWVKCWIPVEIEDRLNGILLTKDEAQYELEHQEMMQPENRYEIEEAEVEELKCSVCGKVIEIGDAVYPTYLDPIRCHHRWCGDGSYLAHLEESGLVWDKDGTKVIK